MNAKLLDESPLLVMPSLARDLGLNEAIVVQQLHWVLGRDSVEVHDDRRWIRADLKFWAKQFPWWSEKTIGRVFERLEGCKLVETRRTKNAKIYTILYENAPWTGQPVGPETDRLSPETDNLSDPRVRETGEKDERELPAADGGDQLFETGDEKVTAGNTLDLDVDRVWAVYVQHYGHRLRLKELTPPRSRTIAKALKAVGWTDSPDDAGTSARAAAVELCQRAIVGLKSYRADHPDGSQEVGIDVVFSTGPHTKFNLTDWIGRWADAAKSSIPGRDAEIRIPLDLAGVPSVTKGTIQARRREVGQMFDHPDSPSAQERGRAAVDWLRQHIGHEPKIEDGQLRGWQLVADYSPVLPSRSNGEEGQ